MNGFCSITPRTTLLDVICEPILANRSVIRNKTKATPKQDIVNIKHWTTDVSVKAKFLNASTFMNN